jgi:hypothetical protein
MEDNFYYALKTSSGKDKLPFIWRNIYPKLIQIQGCGDGPYFKVKVREPQNGEKGGYWGWKDFKDNRYSMIYHDKRLVQICSPDFFKSQRKNGLGKIVKLCVEEIEEIK